MTEHNADLRSRLAKLEELFRRAGTEGERAAAHAAIGRLEERLRKDAEAAPAEMQFSFPDMWTVRLFLAVCRKHGVRPYRYPRQRRTTVTVRAPRAFFDRVIWREFNDFHTELMLYFDETVDHLIRGALRSDGDDSTLEAQLLA